MIQLPLEVVQLLELAVRHPEGEGAVFEGHLESVAALYGVHPEKVERLRSCLQHPAGRAQADEVVARARTHRGDGAPVGESVRGPASPAALLALAGARPHGLELLTRAPIDTAAVLFGVHPFAIDEARLQLAATTPGARA